MISLTTLEGSQIPARGAFIPNLHNSKAIHFSQALKYLADECAPFLLNSRRQGNSVQILTWDPKIFIVYQDKSGTIYENEECTPFNSINDLINVISEKAQTESDKILSYVTTVPNNEIKLYLDFIGFYGLISYETNHLVESLVNYTRGIIPDIVFQFPTKYLISTEWKQVYIELPATSSTQMAINIQEFQKSEKKIRSNLSFEQYFDKVSSIIQHIADGDAYQVDFTQEFSFVDSQLNPRATFIELQAIHQVPHGGYFESNAFQILSLSPELFLKINNGEVETMPIKGTRHRSQNPSEDFRLSQELQESEKDLAELAMIVDLLRNDLGRSSKPGTVVVDYHANLESYSNVHHLVSKVRSKISKNDVRSSLSLLFRAFPGGSITGCPKISAMNLINHYETVPRGIYTGSIGLISITGNLEFNIAIRTILKRGDQISFNGGGGIVYDSSPYDEYAESLHKIKHFVDYFGQSFVGHIYWINGDFKTVGHGTELPDFTKFREGCFETILVKDGHVMNLDQHFQRLSRGIHHFGYDDILPSEQDIVRLVKLNIAETARLNIFITRQNGKQLCVMTIKEYQLPSGKLTLRMANHPFIPKKILKIGYKPLDYSSYRKATEKAMEQGFWDTILFDTDGYILETGRSSIFLLYDEWLTPKFGVVKGLTRDRLLALNKVKLAQIHKNNLVKAKAIVVGNSLMGLRVVESISKDKEILWEKSMEFIDLVLQG